MAVPLLSGPVVGQGFVTRSIVLVLVPDGPPATGPDSLLASLLDRALPVAVAVPEAELATGSAWVDALGPLAMREPGLIEIVVALERGPGSMRRYIQARQAAELRRRVAAVFGAAAVAPLDVVSVLLPEGSPPPDPAAWRSAGFRVLLARGGDGPATATVTAGGQLLVEGMREALGEQAGPRVLDALGAGSDLAALAWDGGDGGSVVAALAAGVERAALAPLRPVDLLLRSVPAAAGGLAVALDDGGTGDPDPRLVAFADAMAEAGLPVTLVGGARPPAASGGHGFCLRADPARPASAPPEACIAREPGDARPLGPVVMSAAQGPWAVNGLDADGAFVLEAEPLGGNADLPRPLEDRVVVVAPADVATPLQRRALVARFVSGTLDGRRPLRTVKDLAAMLHAPDAVETRRWSARRRLATDPPRSRSGLLDDPGALRTDAELAWGYIRDLTDERTGIAVGTASAAGRRNREVTLWDLGSQVQGIRGAHRLGLIDRAEASGRIALLLDHLPTEDVGGHPLPPAMFDGRTLGAARPGFDVCDTGRFLVALDGSVADGLVAADAAAAAVAAWELGAAVRDGRLSNHDGRGWRDVAMSHCTAYIAPAFEARGLAVWSPYADVPATPDGDAAMDALYAAAAIGAYGAEPLLFGYVEGEPDPASRLLALVLFDAQLGWFEATGEPRCVSEAPLDRPPWFTYQGLRLDVLGQAGWTVATSSAGAEFRTDEFRRSIELVSSKSAYLWAAAWPHPYHDGLVSLVRDKARIPGLGFSVGVLTTTMEAVEGYSDVNTNGIILSALARLGG